MQKKVFLQKNLRKGGGGISPLLKYLVLAVVVLTLLVLITPHLLKQKGKEVTRRSIPDKGSVMKELPKPPEPAPGEMPAEMALNNAPAPTPAQAMAPEPTTPPEQSGTIARTPVAPAPPAVAPPVEKDPIPPVKPAEPPALFPKPGSAAATSTTQKPSPIQPPANSELKAGKPDMTASVAEAAKKGQKPGGTELPSGIQPTPAKQAAAGKKMYAVQVGFFKEKQNAEEIQRNLRKKGYDVILCPSAASTSGSHAYTVMTKPVDTMSKAATLVEQIKNEQKVSPIIIKMPPVCDMGAGKKPPVPKAQSATVGQTGQ